MKKRFSLLVTAVALSAIVFVGCGNAFTTSTTAVSGKIYAGFHSNEIYTFKFNDSKNSVLITEGEVTSLGNYSLSGDSLVVKSLSNTMKMTYDTGKDCIYYDGSTFYKR